MPRTHTRKANARRGVRTAFKRPKACLRNERKRHILAVLQRGGWMTAGMVAALAGMPKQAVYKPLNRYHRWGLVHRREQGGLLLYALSDRGRARLKWLERHLPAA